MPPRSIAALGTADQARDCNQIATDAWAPLPVMQASKFELVIS
jgi:hypothetical protein